jgi:hypothetical protein
MGLSTAFYTVDGEIIGESSSGVRLDYLTDALGSVCAKADQTGNTASSARYRPYGDKLTGTDYTFGWVGSYGYRKAANGSYVRARHLSSQSSWRTVDGLWPVEPQYQYSNGNPTTHNDPSGMECKMKHSDLNVIFYKDQCKAKCKKEWWDVYSYCSGDDAAGWPYPWDGCQYPGRPNYSCTMSDNPGISGNFAPCDQPLLLDLDILTCVCCAGYSACFKWGVIFNATNCDPFCFHYGPVWADPPTSLVFCRVKPP